jgi:Tfp pilus assembly protein PilV
MTLVELLVTMAIFSVMFLAISDAAIRSRSLYDTADQYALLQSQSRAALTRMFYDLRMAHNVTVSGGNITYYLPQSWVRTNCTVLNNCTAWDANALWDAQLVRIYESNGTLRKSVGGVDQAIFSQDIKTLSFNPTIYGDEFLVTVALERRTAQRAYQVNVTTVVNVRNNL